VKVGSEAANAIGGGGGIGKYLNLKRTADGPSLADAPKKRKLGFGSFDNF
jgi:peptidyl-prolyl cis-trans isomerase-like 2